MSSSYNPSKEEDLTKGHDMAWNERKYNLIKLNKHVEKWKVLRTSSFQRLVIAAALCILSLGFGCYLFITDKGGVKSTLKIISTCIFGTGGLGTLITSLTSLKKLFTKEGK